MGDLRGEVGELRAENFGDYGNCGFKDLTSGCWLPASAGLGDGDVFEQSFDDVVCCDAVRIGFEAEHDAVA